ncbi:hypothetical protein RE0356_43810 [Prescottella equi]|nr:hypothetical protein RE0356_43810 [Prescottella equi]
MSRSTTTTVAPCSSAPHISHTAKSNAYEWNIVHTSDASNRKSGPVRSNKVTTLRCATATPLGRPVEPDV